MSRERTLMNMYAAMHEVLGPSGWWPGETPLEIAVGAVLTQNTNWRNVSRAIDNLRQAGVLELEALAELPSAELEELIRPAGYFRLKARRLGNLVSFFLRESGGDISCLKERELHSLRRDLLQVNGIGPETADCILCYALDFPIFVVDAYTARIFSRHGLLPEDVGYDELQSFFMDALPQDTALFSEYHALLVRVGNTWCKKKSGQCEACPLQPFLDE